MANKKIKGITIQIGADTTGLDTALSGIEKKSKGTKSELAEVNRALKKAPESAELWKQKQELLAKAIQDSREKVKLLENAQAQVNQQFKDSKIGEEQYRAFKRELEYAKAEVGRFEGELENLNKTADSASEDVKNLGDSADNTAGDVKVLGDYADNTADNVKDLGESAGSAGEKAENSGDGFTILKGTIADLAADGIRAAIDGFKELAAEGDTALNILQTKTGATAEQMEDYRQIMNNLYSNNYGDNRGDVANSIAEVKQQLGDISAEQLEKVTETALLLRDTFDFDVNESIRSAKMLMQQFEISAEEAYTLIAQGAQSGLNKNGDLMDVINEYSVHYKQMGYSAEEFFNSLSNGTEAGTFSVDKLGDAMKEFGIRSKDTATTTTEGFELIGLNADAMRNKFSEGGETAKKATQETIDALFALDDKVIQNQAGVDLFGTMWEDLGAEGIAALSNVTGEADKTATTLKDIADIKYNDLGSQVEQLRRTIVTEMLEPIGEKALPKVKSGVDWIIDNLPEIKDEAKNLIPYITGLGSGFAVFKISGPIIKGISDIFSSLKSGTSILKTFNSVLSLTPTTAAIAGITALAGAVVTLALSYKEPQTEIEKAIDKQKEYNQKIQDETTALKDAKTAAEESAGAEQIKFDKAQALWQELDKLADSQGKVSEKDQARADFITNELENLTGIEIEMIDGQIQKYDELKKSIEDVIEQKKAEAVMSAFNGTYEESITQQVDAQKGYREAKEGAESTQKQIDQFEKYARFKGYKGDFSEINENNIGIAAQEIGVSDYELSQYLKQKNLLVGYQETMEAEMERYKQADENIQKMEKAQEAYYEGNYDEAIAFLREERQINFDSEKFQRQSNQAKLNDYKAMLSDMQSNYELALEANNEKDMAAWQSKIDNLLIRAKQDGIDIGDKLEEGYQERFNKIIDSNTEALYNTNNLVMENINSAWDVAINEARGYAAELAEWTQKIYRENNLIQKDSVNSPWDAELKINGKYATGGYISSGNTAVVAESGPELLEIMNGGVRVTPLTGAVRNTEVDSGTTNKTVNIFNTIKVDKISSDYDVSRLSERLSFEERRAEIGKGQ